MNNRISGHTLEYVTLMHLVLEEVEVRAQHMVQLREFIQSENHKSQNKYHWFKWRNLQSQLNWAEIQLLLRFKIPP